MGNNSSRRITAQDRAILDLKLQRDKIKQHQKKLQTVLDYEHNIVLQCLKNGQKEKARLALRRKKFQKGLLEKADQQLEVLEQLTQTIEFAQLEKAVLYGLQQGNLALKEINKEIGSIESVERLMEETQEGIAYQKEVSELLAGRLTIEEEEEVEDELERIEREETESLVTKPVTGRIIKAQELPSVPSTEPVRNPARVNRPATEEETLPREMIPA